MGAAVGGTVDASAMAPRCCSQPFVRFGKLGRKQHEPALQWTTADKSRRGRVAKPFSGGRGMASMVGSVRSPAPDHPGRLGRLIGERLTRWLPQAGRQPPTLRPPICVIEASRLAGWTRSPRELFLSLVDREGCAITRNPIYPINWTRAGSSSPALQHVPWEPAVLLSKMRGE